MSTNVSYLATMDNDDDSFNVAINTIKKKAMRIIVMIKIIVINYVVFT